MTDQNLRVFSKEQTHFLQSKEWAEVKAEVGWIADELTWQDGSGEQVATAQILIRTVHPFKFGMKLKLGYIPRGPLLEWSDEDLRDRVLTDIENYARKNHLMFVKIDPDVEVGRGIPGSETEVADPIGGGVIELLDNRGWKLSPEQIQFKNTMLIDLSHSEESLLSRMKQKTRYNIRLALKSNLVVRAAQIDELPFLYQMYAETANRDGFIIRPRDYYLAVWEKFIQADKATALIAEVDGTAVAGLVLFYSGERAWYVYGMSSNLQREKMPNYLLQWEAIRLAKGKGCKYYDLWGAPEVFSETDPMFGVFRFKEGLGAEVVRTIGAWDLPVNRLGYTLYQQVLPRLLAITRALRRKQIQQEVQ